MSDNRHRTHVELQRYYFDKAADIFKQPIPAAIEHRTRQIINYAKLTTDSRVLDVGTGLGVLIVHFLQVGVRTKNIVGCDLSSAMITEAKSKYPEVTFWQGDVLDFPDTCGTFDAIFFNACFGNFDNPEAVIKKATSMLSEHGQIVISHPMGARFVEQLHHHEPDIVPHMLPNEEKLHSWTRLFPLELETYINERNLYVAILKH